MLFSVAFLESAINELFTDSYDDYTHHIGALDDSLIAAMRAVRPSVSRNRLEDKFALALRLAGREPMDRGAQPYQDFKLSLELRNQLVHWSPESALAGTADEAPGTRSHRVMQQLSGKGFDLNPFAAEGNAFFPDKCLGAGCAEWMFRSCVLFADEFYERLELEPQYRYSRKRLTLV